MSVWSDQLAKGNGFDGSLFLSRLYDIILDQREKELNQIYGERFPRGIPNANGILYFLLEDAIDWIHSALGNLPQPFLAYFQLLPPHSPYKTRAEFVDIFDDGWRPEPKPPHLFSEGYEDEELARLRRFYDEYIAYVDAEFGRLYNLLAKEKQLDNTWIVLTSDHGEMFERGILSHGGRTLHQPLLRVPLLISAPGQTTQTDVYSLTSCVDLLPTLMHIAGQPTLEWCEGEILPPFNQTKTSGGRAIFALEAQNSLKYHKLTIGAASHLQDRYKLTYYFDHTKQASLLELFDLENDPEELEDLIEVKSALAEEMLNELKSKLRTVDEPYPN